MSDPVPVIPLEYARPERPVRGLRLALRICHVFSLVVCAIAFSVLFVNVESVLVTGPVIFLLGLAMLGIGAGTDDWVKAGFGIGHVCICVLLFVLVNRYRWSPREADIPFKLIGGFYVAA